MNKSNPEFLNGVPELLVLQLLARREMYGYQIVKEILACSNEEFRFGEGCIYPCLHEMEKDRLVTSRRMDTGGRSRVYYRLTDRGRKRLEIMRTEWNRVASGIALVLGGQHA
ncbi:MAG TPA: helix-turn-helix transcriptional regulator [Verrucomicrobiae bacterium]|nr:helix-turn-helix transcriptional regulator [Verrucomicrobiae bacterium]